MSPAVSSVISPATSAYGFGDHMESPALSQAGGEGDDAEAAKRRTNPLIDLIESEKRYVDELGMVIRVRWRAILNPLSWSLPEAAPGRTSLEGADALDHGHPRLTLSPLSRLLRKTESGRRLVATKLSAAASRPHVPLDRGRLQDQSRLWLRVSTLSLTRPTLRATF